MVERNLLKTADESHRFRAEPRPCIAMLGPVQPDPPALPRQTIGFAYHQHGQFGLVVDRGGRIDRVQCCAQGAHLGPGEPMTEQLKNFRIAYRPPVARGCDQQGADMGYVGNGDGIVHRRIITGGGAAGNPIAKAAGLQQKGLDAM